MQQQTKPLHSILNRTSPVIACRICAGELAPAVDFGRMPLANAFLKQEDFSKEYFFNLTAGVCTQCFMFQLMEQPDPSRLFHGEYPFFTGSSVRMGRHFQQLASDLKSFINPQSFIVEIGSNDGTLLQHFHHAGFRCLGLEPSANAAARAAEKGIPVKIQFFNLETARQIYHESGSSDLIVAANCLCHIPDQNSFFQGVAHLLSDEGIAVFEDPYLGDVLEKTAYDQIYDEHVFLFSVTSMTSMVQRYGFEIFALEPQWTHGGSMRYFICRKGKRRPAAKVEEWAAREAQTGYRSLNLYESFRKNCENSRRELLHSLSKFKNRAISVAGYAATSKSTTVLNYCGIGPDLISFISDTTPEKQGKYTPGTHIPVLPYEEFQKNPPKVSLLFAWNHADEILAKERRFSEDGGKWLRYVPKVRIE